MTYVNVVFLDFGLKFFEMNDFENIPSYTKLCVLNQHTFFFNYSFEKKNLYSITPKYFTQNILSVVPKQMD